MLNVPELERRWKRHRRRKFIPLYTAISIALITSVLLLFIYLSPDVKKFSTVQNQKITPNQVAVSNEKKQTKPTAALPIAASDSNTTSPKKPPLNEQTASPDLEAAQSAPSNAPKLAPSMAFMKDVENEVLDYYFQDAASSASLSSAASIVEPKATPDSTTELPSIQAHPITTPKRTNDGVAAMETKKSKISEAPHTQKIIFQEEKAPDRVMHIQRENDMKDIQDVIARFKKNKNPALSLFVAKRYYRIGNYQQAYNYALITNELDNNIEDSWLIFAKSLYKLGQTKMAVKTLKTYQSDSGSVKAKITLDQMTEGNFE